MSLRRRLFLVFGSYVVIILVGGAAVLAILALRRDALRQQSEADVAAVQVAELEVALANQQIGQRGFLVTGDEAFLEPFQEGRAEAARILDAPELTGADSRLARLTGDVDESWRRWRREAAGPQIDFRRAGNVSAASGLDALSTRLFEQLRADVDRLRPAVAANRRAADERSGDIRLWLNVALLGILAATLATTAAAFLVVRRWVTRPIDTIAAAVRNVRAGARHTTVPATGPRELARLANDVEGLRRRLNLEIIEAVRAREAVEESASVLLSLRSQLEPEVEGLPGDWTLAAQVQPAEGVVAGDCYDILRLGPVRIAVLVVDISGHGAVSGILALRCKELLRAALRNGLDPGDAVDWAADQLDDLGDESFLSAFTAIVDLDSGEVQYASAGHPPAFVCVADRVVLLDPTGPIVGPIEGSWETRRARLEPGDTLAIYTDGVTEARNREREEFGVDRLVGLVCSASGDEADAVVKRVVDELADYASARLRDDATVVLVCRGPREDRPPPAL